MAKQELIIGKRQEARLRPDLPEDNQVLVAKGRQVSVTEQAIVPALIEDAGTKAKRKFVEFFTTKIENDNTRAAYAESVDRFLHWCMIQGLSIETIEPTLVASYFKQNCPETRPYKKYSKPTLKTKSTKKQHLAAVRQMFDHLTSSGVIEFNPASSVKGPKLVVEKGKTPVLSPEDATRLLESIDVTKIAGLRDRALIGTLFYAFARISAVLDMNVDDLYENGRTLWLRLHEKGGKNHEMPAHHRLAEYVDAYLDVAAIRGEKETPVFRTLDRKRKLTEKRMLRGDAYKMIQRRAKQAGITTPVCNHTGRATGLTDYMLNGGSLEDARAMANHSSSKVTHMYVRIDQKMKQAEVERVRFDAGGPADASQSRDAPESTADGSPRFDEDDGFV